MCNSAQFLQVLSVVPDNEVVGNWGTVAYGSSLLDKCVIAVSSRCTTALTSVNRIEGFGRKWFCLSADSSVLCRERRKMASRKLSLLRSY